jgi:hypothetical protein
MEAEGREEGRKIERKSLKETYQKMVDGISEDLSFL